MVRGISHIVIVAASLAMGAFPGNPDVGGRPFIRLKSAQGAASAIDQASFGDCRIPTAMPIAIMLEARPASKPKWGLALGAGLGLRLRLVPFR